MTITIKINKKFVKINKNLKYRNNQQKLKIVVFFNKIIKYSYIKQKYRNFPQEHKPILSLLLLYNNNN